MIPDTLAPVYELDGTVRRREFADVDKTRSGAKKTAVSKTSFPVPESDHGIIESGIDRDLTRNTREGPETSAPVSEPERVVQRGALAEPDIGFVRGDPGNGLVTRSAVKGGDADSDLVILSRLASPASRIIWSATTVTSNNRISPTHDPY